MANIPQGVEMLVLQKLVENIKRLETSSSTDREDQRIVGALIRQKWMQQASGNSQCGYGLG